ncbi:uncharacterized protein M421DRAFT_422099 [Didymella exigua CBS 183.55]|uniref:C2H2-type domain-containing protein n=1 Tax=Didymella exigua CBS 183.55 TaxID=1150837 RepID=A0A6A5RJ24_9PLEO|nr:uncharacterized protein M421DRAFT_422099 [Didymella exigua CBS 183.55]KAF1927250.1 hypothetical protein M421DRAFT_422099 [Didymella exigua CBS 183.55]
MEQPNSAPYVSSPYSNMVDLPSSHMLFRPASNGPTTPDSRQHSFDESSLFSTVPQEILNFPVSRVVESSLDPRLMDMPGTVSPGSSRNSMSPSQGIATPPSDGLYLPPYPEQLQLPPYQLLEQPLPFRSCSTSHPNWANSGGDWERTYAENDLWSTQPFVAQAWVPGLYDGYAPSNMQPSHAHASNSSSFPPFTSAVPSQFPLHEAVQPRAAADSPAGEDDNEDADSSDEESDWDEEVSDYSHSGSSSSKSKTKTKPPCVRQDRWMVPTSAIQHLETRGYACNVPGCTTAFVRPEHLRRHIRSKHSDVKEYICVVPECKTNPFSRGDNLRDHYWTHVQRGGRNGKNTKFTLQELRAILGPKERKLMKVLREKLRRHQVKEQLKKEQRPTRSAYAASSM